MIERSRSLPHAFVDLEKAIDAIQNELDSYPVPFFRAVAEFATKHTPDDPRLTELLKLLASERDSRCDRQQVLTRIAFFAGMLLERAKTMSPGSLRDYIELGIAKQTEIQSRRASRQQALSERNAQWQVVFDELIARLRSEGRIPGMSLTAVCRLAAAEIKARGLWDKATALSARTVERSIKSKVRDFSKPDPAKK